MPRPFRFLADAREIATVDGISSMMVGTIGEQDRVVERLAGT